MVDDFMVDFSGTYMKEDGDEFGLTLITKLSVSFEIFFKSTLPSSNTERHIRN
jgi:hypothetical protein